MKVIQIGCPKSGNLLLYHILKNIMVEGGIWKDSFIQGHPRHAEVRELELSYPGQANIDVMDIDDDGIYFRVSTIFRDPIHNLGEYIEISPLVWTHSEYCSQTEEILENFDKVVYICRDGRDVAISRAHFAHTSYGIKYLLKKRPVESVEEYLDKRLGQYAEDWARHILGYLSIRNMHWVFFEKLLLDFDSELNKLLSYLNIDLSSKSRRNIKNAVSFEKMKKDSPSHVRHGKLQGWVDLLGVEQNRRFLGSAGDVIAVVGYPQQKEEAFNTIKLSPGNHESQSRYINILLHRLRSKEGIKQARIHELRELNKEKDRAIELKNKEIEQKKNEINRIHNSYSWKIGNGIIRVFRLIGFNKVDVK